MEYISGGVERCGWVAERLGDGRESSSGKVWWKLSACNYGECGCHRCVFVPRAFSVLPFRTRVYPCMRACVCMSECIFMCGRVPPLTFEVGVAADQVTCVGQDPVPHLISHPSRPARLQHGYPRRAPPCPLLPSPLTLPQAGSHHHLLSHLLNPPPSPCLPLVTPSAPPREMFSTSSYVLYSCCNFLKLSLLQIFSGGLFFPNLSLFPMSYHFGWQT